MNETNKKRIINTYIIIITLITVIAVIVGVFRLTGFIRLGTSVNNSAPQSADIDVTEFSNINVDVSVANIKITSGDKYAVSYTSSSINNTSIAPEVAVEGNTLSIYQKVPKKLSLGLKSSSCDIIITVPANTKLSDVTVTTNVGEIEFDNIELASVTLAADVGDISLDTIEAEYLNIKSDVGDVELSKSKVNTIEISSSVGDISIDDVCTEDIKANNSVGDIELSNVLNEAGNKPNLNVKTDIGDVKQQ